MKKSQWYIFSGTFFFVALLFGLWARNRRIVCSEWTQVTYDLCMQRYQIIVAVGFIFIIITIAFFILGLFEKK